MRSTTNSQPSWRGASPAGSTVTPTPHSLHGGAMPTCASCSQESPAEARFCAFCGQPLFDQAGVASDLLLSDVAIAVQSLTQFTDAPNDPRLLAALRPYDEGQFELAVTFLEPLAREGNLLAIFKLGVAFDRIGRTGDAVALWRVASQQGEPLSQNNLGLDLQERGEIAEAEELFRKATAQGNPQATYNLSAILRDRGDRHGYEKLLRDLGRTSYHYAFGRLGILDLEITSSSTDLDVLRAIHHLSLGARQGGPTCCSGMAVAGLRLGQWHIIEPWLDEAVANVPADGSADWIPGAAQSVRLAALLAERRWDDVLAWMNDPSNVTEEVDPQARKTIAGAMIRRVADPSAPEVIRAAYLGGSGSGLGRFGIANFDDHEPMQRPTLSRFPPPAKPVALEPRVVLASDAERDSIIARGDTPTMGQLARAAIKAGRLDEADFWYLEWVTANCPIEGQLEGLTEYCKALLFPQERYEEAALYFSVIDWLPEVSAPPGFIASLLTAETARHFSPLGAVRYSQAWKSVDRSIPLTSDLPLDLQYSLVLAGLMHGDEKEDGAKARAINVGLREQYLSYVAGMLIGLCEGLQGTGVSHEVLARAVNDWIAFRPAREEPPERPAATPPRIPPPVTTTATTTGVPMPFTDVREQAARVSELLRDVWNDDFPEAFPDVGPDETLGLALAHALHVGWIEPDPAMSSYLQRAEDLLASGGVDE